MTPEGKVKAAVKKLLSQYHGIYGWWPVPCGYGENSLDFVGCFHGRFFAIETKAPGKKPTRRQGHVIERIKAAGGMAFVVDGDQSLLDLEMWLEAVVDGEA